ncbi:MAG: ATP-binding protein [Acidimicrobiales bacterium]
MQIAAGEGNDDDAPGRAPSRCGEPPLWEREAALVAVGSLLTAAAAGRGGALFVVGEAGLGKTALVRRAQVMAPGFTVVAVEAISAEASLPFGVAGEALAALGGSAVVLEAEAGAERASRFYRALRTLTEAADRGPVLVVVDDLHWADPDSLELIGFCCRRLAGLAVAVLGTARPWPEQADELVGELVGAGHARLIELAPLSEDGAAALLGAMGITPLPAGRVNQLHRACAGNPLLLEAAGASLAAGDDLAHLGPSRGLGSRMLLARFAGVGSVALRYARAAAIYGPRFRAGLAGRLAGLGTAEADAALARLCTAGLFRAVGAGWVGFVHPLFAQALAEDVPAPVRAGMHAAAFGLLVEARVDPSEAAAQAVAAHLVGDPAAIACLERAGRTALAQGALAGAIIHLTNAVTLAGRDPPPALILTLAEATLAAGDPLQADRMVRGLLAVEGLDLLERTRTLNLLAAAAFVTGAAAEGVTLLDRALDAAAGEAQAVQVLADQAFDSWVTAQGPRRTMALMERVRDLAPITDPRVRAHLDAAWGAAALLVGDPTGVAALQAAADLGTADPAVAADGLWNWAPAFAYLNVAKYLERFDEATRLFDTVFPAAERAGAPAAIASYTVAHTDTLCRLGRLADAAGLVERVGDVGDFTVPAGAFLTAVAAHLAWEDGRTAESADLGAQAAAAVPPDPAVLPPLWLWLWLLEARRHLAAGQPELAAAAMDRTRQLAATAGIIEPCVVPWAPVAIAAYLAAGRIGDATGVVVALEGVVEPLPCRWPRAVAAVGRARLAEIAGQVEEAEEYFTRALAFHSEVAMPLAETETLIDYGAFLRRVGQPRRARAPLARALSLAESCGARRLAVQAATELAACGGRRRRAVPGGAGLTAQEARVAALAAEGRTNVEIAAAIYLSAKTVEHHLGRVYRKLGIASRRELIRSWAADHPPSDPAPVGPAPRQGGCDGPG